MQKKLQLIKAQRIAIKLSMDKVVSVITLKNKGIIYIHSGKALYDKLDLILYNDVNINYLNNSIFSENVDLIFSEKICTITIM